MYLENHVYAKSCSALKLPYCSQFYYYRKYNWAIAVTFFCINCNQRRCLMEVRIVILGKKMSTSAVHGGRVCCRFEQFLLISVWPKFWLDRLWAFRHTVNYLSRYHISWCMFVNPRPQYKVLNLLVLYHSLPLRLIFCYWFKVLLIRECLVYLFWASYALDPSHSANLRF